MTTTKQENNVVTITFGKREKPLASTSSEQVVSNHQQSIHKLSQSGIGKIYWERNTGAYSHAIDFFRILAESRSLRLVHDFYDESQIIRLNVIEWDDLECELSLEQFVYLTQLDPSEIASPQEYVMDWIQTHRIKTEKHKEDIHITRTILREDELDTYHPEKIIAFDNETGDFYGCELKNKLGPIGYGEAQNFAGDIYKVSLLDLMVAAYSDAEVNGNPTENPSMEVTFIEVGETTYTEIPSELLERVIHGAILREANKRWEFIYLNMSPSDARARHFQKISIPKLI